MIVTPTNARSKSIDIKYHYVRGTVSSQNIRFKFVPTTEQQADLLTKSLPSPAVMRFTDLVFGIAHFACVSCAHGLMPGTPGSTRRRAGGSRHTHKRVRGCG